MDTNLTETGNQYTQQQAQLSQSNRATLHIIKRAVVLNIFPPMQKWFLYPFIYPFLSDVYRVGHKFTPIK